MTMEGCKNSDLENYNHWAEFAVTRISIRIEKSIPIIHKWSICLFTIT